MDKETEATARRIGEEHWGWIEQVLTNRQNETKHMFIEGFVHGFKHGLMWKPKPRFSLGYVDVR